MALFKKKVQTNLFDIGKRGRLADIAEKAREYMKDYTKKIDLLNGCMAAFREGKPDNLACFFTNYLSFKRQDGYVNKLAMQVVDQEFLNLVSKPACLLIEESSKPGETLELMTKGMSPYFKQIFLDMVLRNSSSTHGWYVTEAVLAAGADPNTGSGRPVANATDNYNEKIIELLYRYGANFRKLPAGLDEGLVEKVASAFEECKRKGLSVDFGKAAQKIDMAAKETTTIKPLPLRKPITVAPDAVPQAGPEPSPSRQLKL